MAIQLLLVLVVSFILFFLSNKAFGWKSRMWGWSWLALAFVVMIYGITLIVSSRS
jgi:hypothetical protein